MSLIVKIFGIGIIVVVADMLLAQAGKKHIAFGVAFAGVILVLALLVPEISKLFDTVVNTFNIN